MLVRADGGTVTRAEGGERVEWRGDLFRSDLARALPRLPDEAVIERPFRDTITVFYAEDGAWVDDHRPVRIRAYGDLPDPSPEALTAFIQNRLRGKIQVKHAVPRVLGDEVYVESRSQGRSRAFPYLPRRLSIGQRVYTPHSARIARRVHYAGEPLVGGSPDALELHRVTVDLERRLYRLAGRDEPAYLGELGPRIEVKAPDAEQAARIRQALQIEGIARTIPFRSLELLFQDLLLDSVAREQSAAEVEAKLEVVDSGSGATGLDEALHDWVRDLPDARMLLPFPHRIVRLRRYHVCWCAGDEREWTVVETMSGKLSAKIKAAPRVRDDVLLRDTQASHATDREGSGVPLLQFLAERRLIAINAFDKHQVQFPFALAGGRAFIVKVDDCRDPQGNRLVQCELERIGSIRGERVDEESTVADTARLLGSLRAALGARVKPTTQSKHEFFSRRAQ